MINRLRQSVLCCRLSLIKALRDPRTFAAAALLLAFLAHHLSSLVDFSTLMDISIAPWVFPHLLTPPILLLYGGLTILLFCDAPFLDDQAYYAIIRTGRLSWILGQLMYILLMSLIYTVFFYLSSVISLFPNVELSTDWGSIIKTLAINPGIVSSYGLSLSLNIVPSIVTDFGAVEATLISLILFWLNSVFIGTLVFACNLMLNRFSGLIISGFFVCVAYFVYFQGGFFLGSWLGLLSPVSWVSMRYLDWSYSGTAQPTPVYAISCLLSAIILMSAVSTAVFCKRDTLELVK